MIRTAPATEEFIAMKAAFTIAAAATPRQVGSWPKAVQRYYAGSWRDWSVRTCSWIAPLAASMIDGVDSGLAPWGPSPILARYPKAALTGLLHPPAPLHRLLPPPALRDIALDLGEVHHRRALPSRAVTDLLENLPPEGDLPLALRNPLHPLRPPSPPPPTHLPASLIVDPDDL